MQEQPVDPHAVRKDWAVRRFSCELWEDPPGREWNDFVHSTDKLVMVIEGSLEFEVNGRTHHPRPGEEIFIPAARPTASATSVATGPPGSLATTAEGAQSRPRSRERATASATAKPREVSRSRPSATATPSSTYLSMRAAFRSRRLTP